MPSVTFQLRDHDDGRLLRVAPTRRCARRSGPFGEGTRRDSGCYALAEDAWSGGLLSIRQPRWEPTRARAEPKDRTKGRPPPFRELRTDLGRTTN